MAVEHALPKGDAPVASALLSEVNVCADVLVDGLERLAALASLR